MEMAVAKKVVAKPKATSPCGVEETNGGHKKGGTRLKGEYKLTYWVANPPNIEENLFIVREIPT